MQHKNDMEPGEIRNLIIYGILCMVIYLAWDHYLLKPRMEKMRQVQALEAQRIASMPASEKIPEEKPRPREAVLAESPRVKIDNGSLFGSLALKGGRIDDISLQRYHTTLDKTEHVVLLAPSGTEYPEYIEYGWVSDDTGLALPGPDTLWQVADGGVLSPDHPVTLRWDNGHGLVFERRMEIDANYMITVTQRVTNNGSSPVNLNPYGLVSEHDMPADLKETGGRVFEGMLAWLDGKTQEHTYGDIINAQVKNKLPTFSGVHGWTGISQKYWFAGVVPDQSQAKTFRFIYTPSDDPDAHKKGLGNYQADMTGDTVMVPAKGSAEYKMHLFIGAKEAKLLQAYADAMKGTRLDLIIDWGWFWFLAKPFFYVLDLFGRLTGNMGVAIILLTLCVRACVFPLASKSFRSFAMMSKLSPQMADLRKQYGDDRQKLQAELVKLYEKEKVNPMAGCFPLMLQFPIFLALYKVLSVTIEMRHAPFFGWIHDLSARDPTSVFNLFGLIPWEPPQQLMIGGWSCFMLMAMMAQRQLSPPAQDKIQDAQMAFMPFFVTWLMSAAPAGLVIYWAVSNSLSVLQQYVIMRSLGAPVNLLTRTRKKREMKEMIRKGPTMHPELKVAEDELEKALFGENAPAGENENYAGQEQASTGISAPKPKKKKKR